jgi:hypothetical protein
MLKKALALNTVPPERVEHYYSVIFSHLRHTGTWKETVRKFPPNCIRAAVKQILERFAANEGSPCGFDWGTEYELLKDYSNIGDFIEYLEKEHRIPNDWAEKAHEFALNQLEEDATALGKIIITPAEYFWFENCERRLKRMLRAYPLSCYGLNV